MINTLKEGTIDTTFKKGNVQYEISIYTSKRASTKHILVNNLDNNISFKFLRIEAQEEGIYSEYTCAVGNQKPKQMECLEVETGGWINCKSDKKTLTPELKDYMLKEAADAFTNASGEWLPPNLNCSTDEFADLLIEVAEDIQIENQI